MSGEGGAFAEPWQAQAFALALALQDQGLVSPAEWAAALGRERGRGDLAADGSDYYHGVVAAPAFAPERPGQRRTARRSGWKTILSARPAERPRADPSRGAADWRIGMIRLAQALGVAPVLL